MEKVRKPCRKMFRDLAVFYLFLVPFCGVSAEETLAPSENVADPIEDEEDGSFTTENLVEDTITKFTTQAQIAMHTISKGFENEEEITNLLNEMEAPLDQIMKLMNDQSNIYKFIEAKGIDRVILPYLHLQHTELRTQLLKLTQLLFDVAPNTTSVMIPIGILDKLLDIFEEEDSLQLKARTMYILYAWLPDNPKVQARLMKIKGLEPFYEQVHKLDANIIQTQLRLFSKVIKDHIKVRSDENEAEPLKIYYYKKIGLIERLSTPRICHGLFDIFQLIWQYGENNKDFMVPVFEILTDVQPYCTDTMLGRTKTLDFLSLIHEHLKSADESAKGHYEELGVNTTNLEIVLQKYIERLKKSKDEL